MTDPEDPTRRFLDQTVPKHDEWEGREPEDTPARPRHIQHPPEPPKPPEPLSTKDRRKHTLQNAAWVVGPTAAFAAGAALSNDDSNDDDADTTPTQTTPDTNNFGEMTPGF